MSVNNLFGFGIVKEGYTVPVINEREARAAAGILFLIALLGASQVWFTGNLTTVRIFIVAFTLDFTIRVLINPKFSPSLILGKLATIKQQPEYVGAPQKRFAWGLGLVLAVYMLVTVVLLGWLSIVNLIICGICLTLLFLETAFGICVGCTIFKLLPGKQPEACPGGACSLTKKDPEQRITPAMILILIGFASILVGIGMILQNQPLPCTRFNDNCQPTESCTPPNWAIEIGHEEIWKEHHNCQ